ncbi:MAG: LamG domain-containing protein [Pirellulales bacterium]
MAYQCVNASNQYFNVAALNVSVPPVTFSMWINVASVIAKESALFLWRGSINTGVLLHYTGSTWELRYYVAGGTQWQAASGLFVSTGVWQHICVAISSSQARLYLNGASFTNNVSHATANINAAGDLANDPFNPATHTSFNGLVAEAAVWTAALSDEECLTLSKRISPLGLTQRLHDLVLYKDLVRDLNRGIGPALTAVNSPSVSPHPPLICPFVAPQMFPPRAFGAPYRAASAVIDANRTLQGFPALAGAALGVTHPIGEVSN